MSVLPPPSRTGPRDVSFSGAIDALGSRRRCAPSYCRGVGILTHNAPPPFQRGKSLDLNPRSSSFVMSRGEYIAPDKIENVLVTSRYVAQAFVYGDNTHETLVAVVVPEDYAILALAERLQIKETLLDDLCRHPKIVREVLRDIAIVSKEGKLYGFETVRNVLLHPTPFSIDNDLLLVPGWKLHREAAKTAFKVDIDRLYAEIETSTRP
ncbi:Aste57867_19198 [Aphanomyces stellatus]|uniref:Aste57867_19198 protein n=1 Tax=Aphanomyces stellatus TaxID=120398 RepID=A0A485LC01_9STRA|nr:hypothetical protein As57867_019134 [Aphanomyces stellatus]VFT95919.1 Aste57867_19198 [Aphanomyces stellatus]